MTWSNSHPAVARLTAPTRRRFQRKRPRRGGTWGRLTERPTEGGWFLAGCSARSTPPSADNSICSVKNRSRNLCRETGFFVLHHARQKDRPKAVSLCGDGQMEKAAGSPCGLRVKIECI
jgi:hypothetical protein